MSWGLIYDAATVIRTRVNTDSALRTRGMKLRERVGFKRAAVPVARKLSSYCTFDHSAGTIT